MVVGKKEDLLSQKAKELERKGNKIQRRRRKEYIPADGGKVLASSVTASVGGDGGGDLFGRAVLEGIVTEGGAPGGRNTGGGGIHWQARDKSLLASKFHSLRKPEALSCFML